MKKLISLLLSAAMMVSTFAVVNAEEESILISKNKPVTAGIIDGESHSDTSNFDSASAMVDGVTTGYTQSLMWYEHSSVDGKMIYLNLDLQDIYTVTKISWRGRYLPETQATSAKYDWWNMKIYGANESDYSDKKLIYTTGSDNNTRDVDFEIAAEDIGEYRYIRFEKETTMGGQELYVYGYKNPASNANLSDLSVDGYSFDRVYTTGDTEYTILSDGFPTDNTITINATAENAAATITGAGTVSVSNYGINEFPVTVTSENGVVKTYTIKFVVGNVSNVALTAVSASHVVGTTTKDAITLFDETTNYLKQNGCGTWAIAYNKTGYIQVDLGKAYNLYQIVIHRCNQGHLKKQIPILASNDPDSGFVQIGTTTGTETTISSTNITTSASLDSTNKYRYIRIDKNSAIKAFDFYPGKIDIYALSEVTEVIDGDTTTITVPCHNYSVGDKVMAIVYNADGTLKSVTPVAAIDAASTDVTLTKAAGEAAKVVVWNNYAGMQPRMDVYDVQ